MNKGFILLTLIFFLFSQYITSYSSVMCCAYPDAIYHTLAKDNPVSKYIGYHLLISKLPIWLINLMNCIVIFYLFPIQMLNLYKRYFPHLDEKQLKFILIFCIPSLFFLWRLSIFPFIYSTLLFVLYLNYGGFVLLFLAIMFHKYYFYIICVYYLFKLTKNIINPIYFFPILYILVYSSKIVALTSDNFIIWIGASLFIAFPYYTIRLFKSIKEVFKEKTDYHIFMQTLIFFVTMDALAYRFLLFYYMFMIPYARNERVYPYAILYNISMIAIAIGNMINVYINFIPK